MRVLSFFSGALTVFWRLSSGEMFCLFALLVTVFYYWIGLVFLFEGLVLTTVLFLTMF